MLLSSALLLAPAPPAPELTVYVSPRGLDARAGSQAAPVRSLKRALELTAGRNEVTPARIVLAPGDYPVDGTIELDKAQSHLVIDGGGKARLLGGKTVGGWRAVSDPAILDRLTPAARKGVRVVALKDAGLTPGVLKLRGFHDGKATSALEVFFDGAPMTLARWPNVGEYAKTAGKTNEKTFSYAGDRPKGWKSLDDVWVFGYLRLDWCDTYDRAVKLDPQSRTVELSREPDYGIEANRRFYFYNVLEELDAPGEYYVDRASNRLYFWPPAPIERGDTVASGIEGPLVRMKGATGVTLRGLRLEAGRDGGVMIEGGANNRVESCLIRNFGTYGVAIDGARDSGVVGCDLTGLGARGIQLIGGDRKTLTPANLYATDNHIWAYSRWPRTYQPGVAVEGVGARVANNLIEDAPHNAILMTGNDHAIERNDVRRVCLETGDSGAVYMGQDQTMRGVRIRFNRFRDIVPTVNTEGAFTNVMSVYLDDQWSGTTIFGNVFEGKGTGVLIGGGRDNVTENNVFVGKDPAFHIDQRGKDWAKGKEADLRKKATDANVGAPPYRTRYPGIETLLTSDLMLATGNTFVRNIVAGTRPFWFQDGLTEASVGAKDNAILPDMTLAQALRMAPPGFKPIPLDKIGLRTKARPYETMIRTTSQGGAR